MNLAKIAVYIPAYNAAKTLPMVFGKLPTQITKKAGLILVVDNLSNDRTVDVARREAVKNKITNFTLLRNPQNLGYGGSQKVGYRHVIRKRLSWVIMIHGDAQYSPGHALQLLQTAQTGKYDLLFGSRIRGHPLAGGMPLHRYFGNLFLTKIQNLLLQTKISEFHSGYRVYRVKSLKKINLKALSSDYHFDTEIIISMVDQKMKIGEMPIPTRYGSEKNYVNIWKYGLSVLISTITYYLHKRKVRFSRKWVKILKTSESH